MTILYINTGSSPNKGDGDSLRLAFHKINQNFDYLDYELGNRGVSEIVGEVMVNDQHQGITAVYYTGTTEVVLSLKPATTSTLGGAKPGNNVTVDANGALSVQNKNILTTGTYTVSLNSNGRFTVPGPIYQGSAYDGIDYTDTIFRADANVNSYAQVILQNHNASSNASTDLVIMNNQGNDFENIIDLGINSSNYSNPDYSVTGPGDGYLFTNGGDLVIGTQTPGTNLVFHAGGTSSGDSAGLLDLYAWRFNRSVQVSVATPGPLNFTVQNTQNNSAATAVYQAINDDGGFLQLGIQSSNGGAIDGNIGPGDSFLHTHSDLSTLHIGNYSDIKFYADAAYGYQTDPVLSLSKTDHSSTFGGHVYPAADLMYDLGSSSTQWRSLYVGTSTIYIGGKALTVDSSNNIVIDGNPVGGAANTGDVTFSSNIIQGTGYELGISPGTDFTTSTQYFLFRGGDDPSHLHFDTTDNSLYDLYVGNDLKYVKIAHTGEIAIGTFGTAGHAWSFDSNGSFSTPGIEDDTTPVVDFFSGAPSNHIVTLDNDWTLKIKSRADGANEGHLWLESGQNTAVKLHGSSSSIDVVAGDSSSTATWTFDKTGAVTFPNGSSRIANTEVVSTNDKVYASGNGPHVIWTASTSSIVAAKVTVRVQSDMNARTELFTVNVVKDGAGNVNYDIFDQVTSTSTYGASVISAGIDMSNHLIVLHQDPNNWGNDYTFSVIEFPTTR